jgi:membrane protease YdiL (CAAX protease family)
LLCSIYAAVLVTHYRLWNAIGIRRLWKGRTATLFLLVPLAESLAWILPDGLALVPPGFGLWALTLLLVGFNEELISRGLVLHRLRESFGTFPAVILTGALFGLQHLSLFATSDRGTYDIVTNILMSATVGFAFAAFQYRFRWIWPLIILHAFADFTAIWARSPHGDLFAAGTAVIFMAYGVLVLRTAPVPTSGTANGTESEPPSAGGARPGPCTARGSDPMTVNGTSGQADQPPA